MINKTIHNYTIKYSLGAGGMAEVWYAENSIGKKAAIKILKKELASHEGIVQRFQNEAKIMVDLDHPYIRKVYDFGEIDNRPAIIMEYLEGEDLSQKLKHHSSYTNQDLIQWWNQAVEALNHTHKKGIVHRDIKPSNLFITNQGNLKLLDFGIAKIKDSKGLTQTGQRMGTLLYMSPEQIKDSKHITSKTDVYSLAISFMQLVSRNRPYGLSNDSSEYDVQKSIVEQEVLTHNLPTPWDQLLKNYVNKAPNQRKALIVYQEDKNTGLDTEETIISKSKSVFNQIPNNTIKNHFQAVLFLQLLILSSFLILIIFKQ